LEEYAISLVIARVPIEEEYISSLSPLGNTVAQWLGHRATGE